MNSITSLLKFFFTLFTIVLYFVVTSVFYIFLKKYPYGMRKILNKIIGTFSKVILLILNIKVDSNIKRINGDKSYLVVGNHLSYIDILVLNSIYPTSFVTSIEMKNTLVLGQITQLAGCLFVNRKNKSNINSEILDITNALKNDLSVTVFPEATSSNGEQVLPFKRSLFKAAIEAKRDVLPVTINYTEVDGRQLSRSNRDRVCWYGDMEFLPHLIALCRTKSVKVELNWDLENVQSYDQGVDDLKTKSFLSVFTNFYPVRN